MQELFQDIFGSFDFHSSLRISRNNFDHVDYFDYFDDFEIFFLLTNKTVKKRQLANRAGIPALRITQILRLRQKLQLTERSALIEISQHS